MTNQQQVIKEEKKESIRDIRDWLNSIGTLLLFPLLAWGWFTIKQSQQISLEPYETRIEHSADMSKISDWTKKLQDGQSEIQLQIQHIDDTMPKVKQ